MVKLIQTERLYEVEYKAKSYTVMVISTPDLERYDYDVFDDRGMVVEDEDVEFSIISYLESKID